MLGRMRLGGFVGLFGLLLAAGCGGGGGGGGTSPTPNSSYQVSLFVPSTTQMIDPSTVFVGESLQLEMTARDANGNLVTIPVNGWSTNAPASVATVSDSGVVTGIGASGTNSYTVQVTVGGVVYSATLGVVVRQIVVTGKVRNTSNVGVQNVIFTVYDNSASPKVVAQTHTTRTGTFRISVPSNAAKFTIDMTPADPHAYYYYDQYGYGTKEYLDGVTCPAPLPLPLSLTNVNALPSDIIPDLKSFGPPPPPTGCVG